MPNNLSFVIDINKTPNVLIVDEIGEFVTSLVDNLLSLRQKVFYCGICQTDFFEYLSGKSNFTYLDQLDENYSFENLDYIFYFPKNDLSKLREIISIKQRTGARLIAGTFLGFKATEEIESYSLSDSYGFKLIFFKEVFGPRVISKEIGELFVNSQKNIKTIFNKPNDSNIEPVFSERLINEIQKISFMPFKKGKVYFLKGETIPLTEFVEILKKFRPDIEVEYKKEGVADQESSVRPSNPKEIIIKDNLRDKIEDTTEWFDLNDRMMAVNVPKEQNSETPKFETEIIENSTALEIGPDFFATLNENSPEVKQEETTNVQESAIEEKPFIDPHSAVSQTSSIESYWKEDKKPPKNIKKAIIVSLFFICILFLFYVLPMVFAFATGSIGIKKFMQVKTDLDQGKFQQALEQSRNSNKYLQFSKKTFAIAIPFYSIVKLDNKVKVLEGAVNYIFQINESVNVFLGSFEKISQAGFSFLQGSSVDWREIQRTVKTDFSLAYQQASLAQLSEDKVEKGFAFFKKTDSFLPIKEYLQDYREKLLKSQGLAGVLPDIVGTEGRKTYLVLFQNNLELRPTGGFINAIGIISLENGRLVNYEISDVYKIDNQLKGQIEPPLKLKEVLGENVWYFRDSNFDPEFSVSANKALWFLDKEMHITADGVIALNLKTFNQLLEVLGEIKIDNYNETLTSNNFFQKTFQYSDSSKISGSSYEEEFITSSAKVLFERLKKATNEEIVKAEGVLFSQLENKEIMFYSTDAEIESQIAGLGWDGNIRQFQNKTEQYSIFNDYLYLNEANLGINKANFFLDRKIEHQIKISASGEVGEKLNITYKNQALSDSWPSGTYKNYLRIYLPLNTRLLSILKTDPLNNDLWVPFDPKNIETMEEHGKTVFGFLLDVPVKSTVKLEINYELSEKIDLSRKINSYLLMAQKQSGSYSDNYQLIVSFPENLVPLRVIPKAVIGGNQLLINENLNKDKIFQIDLAQ